MCLLVAGDGAARVFIWDASDRLDDLAKAFAGYPEAVNALGSAKLEKVPWHHLWRRDGYRTSDWKYVIIR